jgi:hypothetical protein
MALGGVRNATRPIVMRRRGTTRGARSHSASRIPRVGATELPRGRVAPRGDVGLGSAVGNQCLPGGKCQGQLGSVPVTGVADQDRRGRLGDFDAIRIGVGADGTLHPNETFGVDLDDVWLRVLPHFVPSQMLAPGSPVRPSGARTGPEECRGNCDNARERATPAPVQLPSVGTFRYVQYRRGGVITSGTTQAGSVYFGQITSFAGSPWIIHRVTRMAG